MMLEDHVVWIPAPSGITLEGTLTVPLGAQAVILFAHGSGSSRHSPRNQYVARVLHQRGFATLLIDLLTPTEEHEERLTRHLRFDIEFLAERLSSASYWLGNEARTQRLALGYFGASTGAAAALVAAARRPDVKAVVSRGGRPDLAGAELAEVRAATLLIVGGDDTAVLELNRRALTTLRCEKKLEVIPGATHLFEEDGALERVATLASDWFEQYLAMPARRAPDHEHRTAP